MINTLNHRLLLILAGFLAWAQAPDRRVAEWTILKGGQVAVNGNSHRIRDLGKLPEGPLRLEVLDWVGVNVDPPDLERLGGLAHLRELHLPGPIWNQNADGGRDGSRDLKYLAPVQSLQTLTFSYHFLDRIRFKDAGLAEMAPLVNLKELVVRQSDVKGHTMAPFRSLERLDVTLTPFDDQGMEQVAKMAGLQRLRIGDTLITDAGLAHLAGLANLEELDLHGTAVTDAGIAHLAGLRQLRKLNLMGTAVTSAGLSWLEGMTRLEEINLYRTKIGDPVLRTLARLPKLASADLRYSRATAASVETLRLAKPELEILFPKQAGPLAVRSTSLAGRVTGGRLNLEGASIDQALLASLAKLDHITSLNLSGTALTDEDLPKLAPLGQLRQIELRSTYVEGTELASLHGLRLIEFMDFHGSPLANASVAYLAGFPNLKQVSLAATDISDGAPLDVLTQVRSLNLGATDLTDEGIIPVAKLSRLEELVLRDSRITNKGLLHVAKLPALRRLDLNRTRLSAAGMPALAGMTSLVQLSLDYAEIYDADLAKLAPLINLERLSLDSTHIGDGSVPVLSQFRRLKHLNLYHTLVTPEGAAKLKAALPGCEVIYDPNASRPTRRRS